MKEYDYAELRNYMQGDLYSANKEVERIEDAIAALDEAYESDKKLGVELPLEIYKQYRRRYRNDI